MAHRIIEMLIGRLITDEAFREAFLAHPEAALLDLVEKGFDLSRSEIAAVLDTDPALWVQAAERVDPRLQKVRLTGGLPTP
ncbi:MAG: Os1348 family NHLP clan protein [Vicinamibacterales bacterium]